MFKNQRHAEILEILKKEGFAEVKSLGERLFASQPTIRRDLNALEEQGLIRRSHGGAIPADERINVPVSFREGVRTQDKKHICRLAATLIQPGDLIFTDASTTVSHLPDFLKESDDVSVVTNGYPICLKLAQKNLKTFSTGGRLLKKSLAFVGQKAESAVKDFNADLFFFSASSLSLDGRISDYSEEETALRRVMHRYSHRTVFLCDAAKIGTVSAYHAFTLAEINDLITNAPLGEEFLKTCGLTLTLEQGGAYLYQKA